MQKREVKVGMLVAVNTAPDGQVYMVEALDGFTVKLSYLTAGEKVSGGEIDIDYLRKPSKEQLAHHAAQV